MGLKQIRGYLRKRPFSSVFRIFQVLFGPSGKWRTGQKKGEKGGFRPISRTGAQRARRGILMPRGKNCRETIFAAQLPRNYPHHGVNFKSGKNVLSCGGEVIWEAF